MLRFKILASSIPLIIAAIFARSELFPNARACINVGETSVQLAATPWQAQLHVSFTNDPSLATVRVQAVDESEMADFALIDDIDTAEADPCGATTATRFIAIATSPSVTEPVIYLSRDGAADYRVFVKSKTYTVRDAAALIVGANGARGPMAAASL